MFTAADYQRDYEAMREWVTPHTHDWRYDLRFRLMTCAICGKSHYDSGITLGETIRKQLR